MGVYAPPKAKLAISGLPGRWQRMGRHYSVVGTPRKNSAAAQMPRVAVVGVGGVGGVISASLATAMSCHLTTVARGTGLHQLREDGLTVRLHEGQVVQCRPTHVLDANEASEADWEPQDIVFVCTKSHQMGSVAQVVAALLHSETVVIPCVNGLPYWYFYGNHSDCSSRQAGLQLENSDPSGLLWKLVPPDRVVGTVGMVSGDREQNGRLWCSKWPSSRNHLVIGDPASGGGRSSRTDDIAALFTSQKVPIRIEVTNNIYEQVFNKLLINCSLNPISVLTRFDCGEIVESSELRQLLKEIVCEALAVAKALDPPLTLHKTADYIIDTYTGQFGLKTSMLQDFEAGRELETATIVHALVELAEAVDVDTPRLRTMQALLAAIDKPSKAQSIDRHKICRAE